VTFLRYLECEHNIFLRQLCRTFIFCNDFNLGLSC